MNSLPLHLLTINQLGERLEETLALPVPDLHEVAEIARMLKDYKFGILVGSSWEDPAHVTAVATIETPYEIAFWHWELNEGRRETDRAYREASLEHFEETLQGQATMDGQYPLDEESEEDDYES